MNQQLTSCIPHELNVSSLANYIHWVHQIPLLSQEEEQSLAEDLVHNGNIQAAQKLVLSHLRLVNKIAKGYEGYGLAVADLIQEGTIGLMKAVKRFDPTVGVRLVSFAIHWIRAEMHEFIIRNWRIVKIATTKAQRKLFFNLRRASKKLGWFSDDEIKAVAEQLGVKESDVKHMEMRLAQADSSFDHFATDEGGDLLSSNNSPEGFLEDHAADPALLLESDDWQQQHHRALKEAIVRLDPRSRDIIQARWLQTENKRTLHDLAKQYNISAERVRQLEKNALQKIRHAVQESL